MEGNYGMATMQGVVVYLMLLGLMLLGGIAFWFGYRVFGAGLMVGSAALFVWYVAGAPI
jgi:hypothetical protein